MIESIPTEDGMAKAPRKNKKSFEKISQPDPKVPLTKEQVDSTRDPLDILAEKFHGMELKEIKKTDSPYAKEKMAENVRRLIEEL